MAASFGDYRGCSWILYGLDHHAQEEHVQVQHGEVGGQRRTRQGCRVPAKMAFSTSFHVHFLHITSVDHHKGEYCSQPMT